MCAPLRLRHSFILATSARRSVQPIPHTAVTDPMVFEEPHAVSPVLAAGSRKHNQG